MASVQAVTAIDHPRSGQRPWPGAPFAMAADAVAVLVFVGIGRHAHDHGVSVAGVASTAWPFLAGTAIGWALAVGVHRDLASAGSGLVVCLATVGLGMVLRVLAGHGTAVSFVGVALAFLGLFLLGWRCAALLWLRWRGVGPAGDAGR